MTEDTRYVVLMHPLDEVELAFVRSILTAEGVAHVVRNEHFGGMYIGPQIELYNSRAVLVDRADEERARGIVEAYQDEDAEFMEGPEPEEPIPPSGLIMRVLNKVRMVFEFFLFGWMIPRHRKSRIYKD